MPPSAEDTAGLSGGAVGSPSSTADRPKPGAAEEDAGHDILIEPQEDRWHWRRRIRQNPRQLVVYRLAVGLLGLLLVLAGLATGWIPGPGGIPLILLGLAVWSSEFHWANKLMLWFKEQLKRYAAWPRSRQVVFWVAFFVLCGTAGYSYMLVLGVPGWLPNPVEGGLLRLPGL